MTAPVREVTVKYARVPTANGVRALKARLFLPEASPEPHPVMIWLHSGGFRTGRIEHPAHDDVGQLMAERGVATAFIEYRLRTPPELVSEQSKDLLGDFQDDTRLFDFGLNPYFTGSAAVAAMEDCIIFFQWLDRFRDRHGIGRHVMLGGSSSGAITVLNTLFLSPHLGIRLPPVSSAFVYSGAFAYPSFYAPNQTRILAVHNETDAKMPIASIRRFANEAAGQCTLIEPPDHAHGDLRLGRGDTRADAIDRMIAFDRDGSLPLPASITTTA